MTIAIDEKGPTLVPRPKLGLFWTSLLSLIVPVILVTATRPAGYLIGYLCVLLWTVPSGLIFKAQCMNAEALGVLTNSYPKQRRRTRWIFLMGSLLALGCAARFAIAVS